MQPTAAFAVPPRAGVGLRAEHYADVLEQRPSVAWFEVHSENYFGLHGQDGGQPLELLQQVRRDYPISLHGVGLSLGSTDALDMPHLHQLKRLIEHIEPGLVSEHVSWGSLNGAHFNDLLPLPYTEAALDHMVQRVDAVQSYLGRQILIENVSSYLQFADSTISEWEFVGAIAKRSGCGILLDINNVYVNAKNHGFDPLTFIRAVPVRHVQELHLAGHTVKRFAQGELRIDTHDQPVCSEVWRLYRSAVARFGALPSLIEWDSRLPALDVLLGEAAHADAILAERHARIA